MTEVSMLILKVIIHFNDDDSNVPDGEYDSDNDFNL